MAVENPVAEMNPVALVLAETEDLEIQEPAAMGQAVPAVLLAVQAMVLPAVLRVVQEMVLPAAALRGVLEAVLPGAAIGAAVLLPVHPVRHHRRMPGKDIRLLQRAY